MIRQLPVGFLSIALLGGTLVAGFGEEVEGGSVSHPVWGVTMQLSAFEIWEDHPLRGQANLVLAGHSEQGNCRLAVSMFANLTRPGTTAGECRKGYAGNPAQLRKQSEVTIHADELSPITYTLFDQQLASQGLMQNQLYAYWTRAETCFELHVSSLACELFPALAPPILRSVEIVEDVDVTLETVGVAQALDSDPHDWNVHLQVAGHYLHSIQPPVTVRARRFYQSARRLAHDELEPEEQWLIAAGIGLSWLIEDNGANAIPYLERSVKIAQDDLDANDSLDESLYNLACAHSLVGDTEIACDQLKRVLSRQPRSERKKTLSGIRKDPQLKGVTKATCFETLKAMVKKR